MISAKQLAGILCAAVMTCGGPARAQTPPPPQHAANLARGVNILGYDKAFWRDHTQGRFKERYFTMLREAGFTAVRVNLTPFAYMDDKLALSPHWLDTLDWVVARSLATGLTPVLDLHEFGTMAADPEGNQPKFLAVWRQLAERYRNQPPEVVFELLNEPNGKLTDALWNSYAAEALAIVRKSNPTRKVIIGPGHWNGIDSLPALVLPEQDRNLIVTVHYYDPMRFTHQGAPWSADNKGYSGITWTGSAAEKQAVDTRLGQAADWGRVHARPLFLGEFGAYDKGDMASRARYTAQVARTAERLGMGWAYWQFDSDFIVYDIDQDAWVAPIRDALTK